MKATLIVYSLALALTSVAILRGQDSPRRTILKARPSETDKTATPPPVSPPAPADTGPAARVVQYGEKDVIQLRAKLRFTTLIVLPTSEKILDFVCGDKEFWVVNGADNMAYVKPAKAGAQTDLHLITGSGNIYSFTLTEASETQDATDLKVFIEPKDESILSAASSSPRFVPIQDLEDYRQQAELARDEARRVKQAEQAQIDRAINHFLSTMRFAYSFKVLRKPFNVSAMYHDDKFTYIQARPLETPVLYEIQDGKPNLVDFEYSNGLYVVPKILDRGYLAIGKAKLRFARKD